MRILLPLLVFTSALAQAAVVYDVDFKSHAGVREIANPHVTLVPGKVTRLTKSDEEGRTDWDISARDEQGAILISAMITQTDQDGKRTNLGRPQIQAIENEPAAIFVGDKDSESGQEKPSLSMSVLAKKRRR